MVLEVPKFVRLYPVPNCDLLMNALFSEIICFLFFVILPFFCAATFIKVTPLVDIMKEMCLAARLCSLLLLVFSSHHKY
jgi:hypothetical protein